MHILFALRGIKKHAKIFTEELGSQFLPFKYYDKKDKKLKKGTLQVRLSPIQFWDVSFPEPYKDAMLTTLFGPKPKVAGKAYSNKIERWISRLRWFLGLKPIPKDYKTDLVLPTQPAHLEMIGIGMKEDRYENGQEMI